MMRPALVLCCCLVLVTQAAADPSRGIATRYRPSIGQVESGMIGFPWADARTSEMLPFCHDNAVLGTVASRFAGKESQFWNSSMAIAQFDRVREVRVPGWTQNNLPRRGCMARVLTTDGRWRSASYSIIANHGMLGYGWGVTWCVAGRDQGWAYNPECKMARP